MRVESLEAREVFTVTFHGGALLSKVEAQAVYLGSDWNTNSSLKNQTAAIDSYLSYLVQSPYMDMLTSAGYGVARGSSSPGVVDNIAISKSSNLSDSSIQSYLKSMISAGQVAAPDANRLYVVYVEPGVVVSLGRSTSQNSFLGYHGAFAGPAGKDVRYAVMPYPGSPNPSPTSQGIANVMDELTMVTSHELSEAVTDPDVNYKGIGWYDDQLDGEIGDLTSRTTTLNGYLVQAAVDKNDRVIFPTVTPPTNPLAAPQNVSLAALTSTSARVTWSASTTASGYRILQVTGTQTSVLMTAAAGATSATLTGFNAGSKITLIVEAFNGTTKADSASVTVNLPPLPTSLTVPQLTVEALSSRRAVMSWTTVPNAEGYRIYVMDGTKPLLLGTVDASTNSVLLTGLTPGQTAQLMVEAFSGTAIADSAWVTVTTPYRTRWRLY